MTGTTSSHLRPQPQSTAPASHLPPLSGRVVQIWVSHDLTSLPRLFPGTFTFLTQAGCPNIFLAAKSASPLPGKANAAADCSGTKLLPAHLSCKPCRPPSPLIIHSLLPYRFPVISSSFLETISFLSFLNFARAVFLPYLLTALSLFFILSLPE